MDIWLVRSSLATEEGHLSAEGRRVIRALGQKVKLTEEPSFDRLVSSPAPSAVQTAELFADRVDYIGVVETIAALGSANAVPQVLVPPLLERGGTLAIVADEPLLSAIGAFLVGRPTFPPLAHAQVSVVHDRQPAWCLRPGDLARQLLLVA